MELFGSNTKELHKHESQALLPVSKVFTVITLLILLMPETLKTLTVMLYILPGSSPVIIYVVLSPSTTILSTSLFEQPTEGSLCHSTIKPVTTVPLGTLPVMVIVVPVTVGNPLRVIGAGKETGG